MLRNASGAGNASCNGGGGQPILSERLWIKHVGLSAISGLAVIGNAALIATIARNRHLRTTTHAFIVSLAAADLLFGFPVVPIHIAAEAADGPLLGLPLANLCLVAMSLTGLLVAISVLSLFAVAVERYLCILHPLKHRRWARPRSVAAVIGALWCYGLLIGAIPMMGWNALRHYVPWEADGGGGGGGAPIPRCHFVVANTGPYIGFFFAVVLLPVYATMPCLFWRMFWTVRRFVSRRLSQTARAPTLADGASGGGAGTTREQAVLRRIQRRSLRLLVVLAIYSVFSWTPELIWYVAATRGFTLTHTTPERFRDLPISITYYQIASNFGFASSALNPYIYGLGNVRIRRAFFNSFRRRSCPMANCVSRRRDDNTLYSASCHVTNGGHVAAASLFRAVDN